MDTKILTDMGLSKDEAIIYTVLLDGGYMPARAVALRAKLGRPLTYKILDDLISRKIVEKKDAGIKVALFAPVHPRELEILLENKKKEIEKIREDLNSSLGAMISKYNLFVGKPNIQFFEGIEGVTNVIRDSYASETEILTYADNESMNKYYPELNKENITMRKRSNIKKRILSLDTSYIRELSKKDDKTITERRLLSDIQNFATVMQIYDNKVAYITLEPDRSMGVIIEDKAIYNMQKEIFEFMWVNAEKIN